MASDMHRSIGGYNDAVTLAILSFVPDLPRMHRDCPLNRRCCAGPVLEFHRAPLASRTGVAAFDEQ